MSNINAWHMRSETQGDRMQSNVGMVEVEVVLMTIGG